METTIVYWGYIGSYWSKPESLAISFEVHSVYPIPQFYMEFKTIMLVIIQA